MSGRTPINITSQTVYTNVDLTDDLFNVFAAASLLLGNDILTDDAISMSGLARFRAPSTINDGLTLDDTVTLVNASVLTQNGDLTLGQSASDAATVRNIAGATWNLANGADITGAGSSQFVNLGTLEQTAGASTIDANFYDRGGTIEANGTLDFASPGYVNRFVDDQIEGSGTFELNGGALVGADVSTSSVDLVSARTIGDVTVSSASVTIRSLNIEAGSVVSLTNPAAGVEMGFGYISGAGEIDIKGNDGVALGIFGFDVFLEGSVTFANFGNTTFTAGMLLGNVVSNLTVIPAAGEQITIENEFGATWRASGTQATIEQSGGSGTSLFINDGTFLEIAGGEFASGINMFFGMNVENNGLMSTSTSTNSSLNFGDASGTSTIDASVSGIGTIDVVHFGSVSFGGSVGSGQSVNFTGAGGTVTIDQPQLFAATISDFDPGGATNGQLVVNTTTWQFQDFVANSDNSGGLLMFSNGSTETAVNLTGTYDPLGFHAAVSGGSTTITYTA
jgi:hypothetical protein